MTEQYLIALLERLRVLREQVGVSASELEERLILGPGWITRFERAETIPSLEMLLAIAGEMGFGMEELFSNLPDAAQNPKVERHIYVEKAGSDVTVRFRYASYDAKYTLSNSTVDEFEHVVKTLRDGLSRLSSADTRLGQALKTDSVTRAFLEAVKTWPTANPSDIWWFLIYRAYCDPFNHPAQFARLDLTQSWKRTGGWALEEILVRHYSPFLKKKGIALFIPDGAKKQEIVNAIDVGDRIEADKIDVVLSGCKAGRKSIFFGVVHVKSSFAERRTDDVPMSTALSSSGYTSPLWTMDCKSTPADEPLNRGELGEVGGRRSAKRRDIEDEGYFTGCFSYNQNTVPSPSILPAERRIYVCDFRNPDDCFTRFVVARWKDFRPA
ncbi:MAG: helix-turn-helix transcriptional regulator [Phycisphaerae bacterium]|nr:helix-turn-helix transcriptional regulator [Phycisphaerae bacterium]